MNKSDIKPKLLFTNLMNPMMLANYRPLDIPSRLSHPMVDDAKNSLMHAISYLNRNERDDVLRACHFGDIAHIKDVRKSGEPYITHPIAVAEILAGFRLDRDTIIAAILHDTVEDTVLALRVTSGAMKNGGATVLALLRGVVSE